MKDKQQSMKLLLHHFLYDTIDVCNHDVITSFIEDETIKFNALIAHSLLKCNFMFCKIWFLCFRNYPTKKDFEEFVNILGGVDNLMMNKHVNISMQNIAYGVSHHNAFTVFQLIPSAQHILTDVLKQLQTYSITKDAIETLLVQKWLHRYKSCKYNNASFQSTDNLLQKYVKIYIEYQEQKLKMNSVQQVPLRFQPMITPLTIDHEQHMTDVEKAQYAIHQNNRFLLHMHTSVFVISQNTNVPKYIIESIQDTYKCRCFIIYIDIVPTTIDHENDNIYLMTMNEFCLLPKCFHNVCCINTCDDVVDYVVPTSSNCIFINLDGVNTKPITAMRKFKITLTNNVQQADPLQNMFLLPDNVSDDVAKYLLMNYLKSKSPFQSMDSRDNGVLYNHFLAVYISSHMKRLLQYTSLPVDSFSPQKHVVCSIDSRFNIATYYAVLASYCNLCKQNSEWDMIIFTSTENVSKYKEYNKKYNTEYNINFTCIALDTLDKTKYFCIETYNSVLKDESFWKCLDDRGYQKCLVVQDDGFLVNGNHIDQYMHYDYVGAPWVDTLDNAYIKQYVNQELVGNGGFSLRDVNMMLNICKKYLHEKNTLFFHNLNEIPEDVYFVKCLGWEKSKIAPQKHAKFFSIEQVIPDTNVKEVVGFHKFWVYHSAASVWNVFKTLLETV